MTLGVRFPIDGQRPSSLTGVAKGVFPRVNEGVRDKLTRGLLNVRDASLILVGKLSGFGGRFKDIDLVSEEVISEVFCGMTSGAFVLSLDRALSRVASCGALALIESETDRFTDGRERVLDVDSLDRRGDLLLMPSFMATFFFAVAFNLRIVGSPVIEDDSLPPSLA